jgi:outer membrane protein assembly factor BamB
MNRYIPIRVVVALLFALAVKATRRFASVVIFGCLAANGLCQQPGTKLWEFPTGDRIECSPAIGADGTIYVGSWDNKLYAVDASGSSKWSVTVGGGSTGTWFMSSPAIGPDGTIYVGSNDRSVYAIHPNGTVRWSFQTGSWIAASPAIARDGTVYVGSGDGTLYAFKREGGPPEWTFSTGGVIGSSPAIDADGTIYFGCDKPGSNDLVYAVTPRGGLKWSFPVGDNVGISSPAIGLDGTIYVGTASQEGALYALNPDGSQKWKIHLGGAVLSPALAPEGTIYVGSSYTNAFWALAPEGTNKWTFYTPGAEIQSTPAVAADGTVYVGCADGKLYALNSDGTKHWEFATGAYIFSSPTIAADGRIYVGSADGKLYAISGSSGLADSPWPKFRGDLRQSGKTHFFAARPSFEFVRVQEDGSFEMILLGRPLQNYALESTVDFDIWYPGPSGSSQNGVLRFVETRPADTGKQFYRAKKP